MRPSSAFPDKPHGTRKDKPCSFNLGALPPFLFFSLLLSTILSLFILYSPDPLRLAPDSKALDFRKGSLLLQNPLVPRHSIDPDRLWFS